jgi:putative membrane protein
MNKIYLTLSLLLTPFLASAHYGDDLFGHHMDMGYGFFGGGIFMLLFWVLIIIGIVYLVKHFSEGGKGNELKSDRAIEILKERYAKGEISKEEFEQKKKELQ